MPIKRLVHTTHEYLGTGMFVIFVSHHILNAAWWKHLLCGRYTPLCVFGTVVDLALAIIMLVLPISGMFLSRLSRLMLLTTT